MLCDNCNTNKATIYLQQTFNNENVKLNLCSSCANMLKFDIDLIFSNIFKEFLEQTDKIDIFSKISENTQVDVKKCNVCENTLEKMKKTGKIGCKNCYTTFKDELKSIINIIQPSHEHVGKVPQNSNLQIKIKQELNNLKAKLKNAINQENYELAAEIRDLIREIEGRN